MVRPIFFFIFSQFQMVFGIHDLSRKFTALQICFKMQVEQQNLSGLMTVLSIVNGMIGGLILLLPVMALEAGWLLTLIALFSIGFISYYSCFLCVLHTGSQPDLDISLQKHFTNSKFVKFFYEFCIWINLVLICILYFELIVIQWIGLVPPHNFTNINAIINGIVLLILVFVIKYRQFGANLMAYGIISIAVYLMFITWVAASENTSASEAQLAIFNGKGDQLAAALSQAFAIQCFFIPVLKKNKETKKHRLYLIIAFIVGGLAYAYIAFMGSYGILFREFLGYSDSQKTIEGYFGIGTWQVNAIQIIYLIHLYSVFPQYFLIGKKRFFSMFGLKQSESKSINKTEVLYILVLLGFCLSMALWQVRLRGIIELNGAVIGFFFIYFFPIAIHIKCKYIKSPQIQQEEPKKELYNEMIEQNEGNKEQAMEREFKRKEMEKMNQGQEKANTNDQCKQPSSEKQTPSETKKQECFASEKMTIAENPPFKCECKGEIYSRKRKVFEICLMSVMLLLGLFTLVDGVTELFQN